jgi:hypothetical protein
MSSRLLGKAECCCFSCPTGRHHPALLAQRVLARLLALPLMNAAQAELLGRALKECADSAAQLAAETLRAAADADSWGSCWSDSTVAAMSLLIALQPRMSQVHRHFDPHIGYPDMRKSPDIFK